MIDWLTEPFVFQNWMVIALTLFLLNLYLRAKWYDAIGRKCKVWADNYVEERAKEKKEIDVLIQMLIHRSTLAMYEYRKYDGWMSETYKMKRITREKVDDCFQSAEKAIEYEKDCWGDSGTNESRLKYKDSLEGIAKEIYVYRFTWSTPFEELINSSTNSS